MIHSAGQLVPNLSAGYRRLEQIEQKYGIRAGMWVSMHEDTNGYGYFQLHLSGSGDIFDHIPQPLGHAKARVIEAFDDPFANALWQCIDLLEACLDRYAGYLVLPDRP